MAYNRQCVYYSCRVRYTTAAGPGLITDSVYTTAAGSGWLITGSVYTTAAGPGWLIT